MSKDLRRIAAGAMIGGLAAGILALPALLPPALADEQPMRTLLSTAGELFPTPLDPSGLVKHDYVIEPSVETEVLRSNTVRKIGYGKTSFVTIAETATGTYSSDGLASPHVRYPGIHVDHSSSGPTPRISIWSSGSGWSQRHGLGASSFVTVTQFKGGRLIMGDNGSCVVLSGAVYC